MSLNINCLNRFIPATFGRTFSISIVTFRSIRGNVEGREVTYPIAGKKPKLVKECREAVSNLKSGKFSIFVV